ncbi:DUF5069 domain-containing protein [Luteolibacter sp. GHJ8]|uniref:DUF5069 domain-containing protein n=1 Tax=Luteolibacter rhizosphaerae TaxID=2989719 RepID=A0ABT3G4S5_9BACT|nr:DUF5069 domain-containing protein [Luteolibacter rhizosphaerae]MCW1914827.1 DUF5069 domain-containing protein [Luteolibacter rhizosphaerae]
MPRSAYDQTSGLVYFPRMCEKIRLHAQGELPADYHEYLGKGFDGRICGFLRVSYDDLKAQVLSGKTDDEVLAWCLENGRGLEAIDYLVWNGFARKRGWRDEDGGSEFLANAKANAGFANRDAIMTMFDFYEHDEGRAS